jgi:hypothetical protein
MRTLIALVMVVTWKAAIAVEAAGEGANSFSPLKLFVSLDGNDAWSGRLASPNIAQSDGPLASLERARDTIREMKAEGPLPDGGVIVELQGGVYQRERPFHLDSKDSGDERSPIVYKAGEGTEVCLVGGQVVTGWRPVADPKTLAVLPREAVGHVVEAELVPCARDLGQVTPGPGWGASDPGLEFYFERQPMTLARWPNHGFAKVGAVLGPTPLDGNRANGCREGVFTFDSDRPKRWSGAKDVMLHGFWANDWADQRLKVATFDTQKRIITLEAEPRHEFGFRSGQWFYAYNLLSELDRPGEWYLDRESRTLYFWPPAPVTPGRPTVSMLSNMVTMDRVAHVSLHGLTLEACRGTAIEVSQGYEVRVVACTVRNTGGWAIEMSGRKSGVSGCDIYNVGNGGVALAGGERTTLATGGLFLENCHVFKFGRWNPINKPGVRVDGVGNRVAHNLFHDSPHAAVAWSGNDHVFEFNEFHSVVQGANDAGVMYAGYSPSMRGSVIRYNYFHDIYGFEGRGCNGVYLDDMFCGTTVFGNIFHNVPRAVFIGGGHDNVVENNVFVDCMLAVHVDARMLSWAAASKPIMRQRLEEVPFHDEPWSTRYPELLTYLDGDFAEPRNNLVARNVAWRGVWKEVESTAEHGVRFVDNLVGINPRFVDEKKHDYSLRQESPAWGINFRRIPAEKIGLYKSDDRASWPVTHEVQKGARHRHDEPAFALLRIYKLIFARKRLLGAIALAALGAAGALHTLGLLHRPWAVVISIVSIRWFIGLVALIAIAELSVDYVAMPRRRFVWAAIFIGISLVEGLAIVRRFCLTWKELPQTGPTRASGN